LAISPPTTEEIDALIRIRLRMLGVDISVLPENDPSAVIDQTRVLQQCRSAMTDTAAISRYYLDAEEYPPVLYPAPQTAWSEVLS